MKLSNILLRTRHLIRRYLGAVNHKYFQIFSFFGSLNDRLLLFLVAFHCVEVILSYLSTVPFLCLQMILLEASESCIHWIIWTEGRQDGWQIGGILTIRSVGHGIMWQIWGKICRPATFSKAGTGVTVLLRILGWDIRIRWQRRPKRLISVRRIQASDPLRVSVLSYSHWSLASRNRASEWGVRITHWWGNHSETAATTINTTRTKPLCLLWWL